MQLMQYGQRAQIIRVEIIGTEPYCLQCLGRTKMLSGRVEDPIGKCVRAKTLRAVDMEIYVSSTYLPRRVTTRPGDDQLT